MTFSCVPPRARRGLSECVRGRLAASGVALVGSLVFWAQSTCGKVGNTALACMTVRTVVGRRFHNQLRQRIAVLVGSLVSVLSSVSFWNDG